MEPLRGSLCVVLGQPGVGKSAFALNWALTIPSPSVLMSLDTDLTTQAIRSASIVSGTSMADVKQNPKAWSQYLNQKVQQVRAYDIHVSPREVLSIIEAEREFWGVSPALTIIDNVSNFLTDGGYEEYRKLFVDLHRIARKGDTFILALHHVTRSAKAGEPLTMASGQYAGEQEAEMVLGLWSKDEDYMNVSILKNRSGRADPSGNLHTSLRFNRETMQVRDLSPEDQAMGVLKGVL